MEFNNLLADDDAVSPVIGVILMVAITVILAAVIGTFVLGLGDQVSNTSPTASFSFDYNDGDTSTDDWGFSGTGSGEGILTVTHDGGDKISADQLSITGSSLHGTAADFVESSDTSPFSSGAEVSAGTSVEYAVDDGDTVRITWQSSNGGDTATLGKWTGPDA